MTIHPVTEKDLPKLHELYTQLIGEESDINDMIRVFHEIEQDPHYIIFGVYDDNNVLRATATLSKCLDLTGDARYYYNMENFVVDSACRRQGYGKHLMQALEDYAKRNHAHYINFTSSSARKDAHAFYETIGYPGDYVKGFKKRLKE